MKTYCFHLDATQLFDWNCWQKCYIIALKLDFAHITTDWQSSALFRLCWIFEFYSYQKFSVQDAHFPQIILQKISHIEPTVQNQNVLHKSKNEKISTFLHKRYSQSLLTQLIRMCNLLSKCKCTYIKFDSKHEEFQTSNKSHFFNFFIGTLLCHFLTFGLIRELFIKQKSVFQYILFFIPLVTSIAGGSVGVFCIYARKLLIVGLNWITPVLNYMDASM